MSSPTRDTENAAALAAKIALKDAANMAFITAADIVIAEMVSQGKFKVSLPVLKPASMSDISTYYRALGYGAFYNNCSSWDQTEWPGIWTFPYGSPFFPFYHICGCRQQCSITISWK